MDRTQLTESSLPPNPVWPSPPSGRVSLVDWRHSAAIVRGGRVNRVELACVGSTISVNINGTYVAVVQDGAYRGGGMYLWLIGPASMFEARFDNLVVTQRGPDEPPPTVPPPPRPGEVILADDFSNPATGWLPTASANPAHRFAYEGGEYQISYVDPGSGMGAQAALPGSYRDVSIRVDARAVSGSSSAAVICRNNFAGEYRLGIFEPARFELARWERGSKTLLADGPLRTFYPDRVNRLELDCVGNTISARINGERVTSREDSTHSTGEVILGSTVLGGEARFDNLVVIQG